MNYFPHRASDFDKAVRICKLPMVYIIATAEFKFIKIGKTANFKWRLSNIQSGCPYALSLWRAIRTPRASEIESALHQQLAHCRERGEWFAPSDADLDYLLEFCALTNEDAKGARRALLQA